MDLQEYQHKAKEKFDSVYDDYFKMFGVLPPFSPDSNYYSDEFLESVKVAIATGRPL